jgi:acetyl-CoA C-acetyltransferase
MTFNATPMHLPAHTPVIVGVAQRCDTTSSPGEGLSPLQALAEVSRLAAADSGTADPAALLSEIDAVTVIRLFCDTMPRFQSPFGTMEDPPWSLARELGARPRHWEYAPVGGDSPQAKLTEACRRVASGESGLVLLAGAEALRTELAARRSGMRLDWSDPGPPTPPASAEPLRYYTDDEERHGMRSASAMYGLISQAIRRARGLSPVEYQQHCGELFSRFAAVARDNPYATRRAGYDAKAIATVDAENPMVGTPYPKLMTASVFVDQAAAVLVCSEERARALGIPRERWVYLQGAASVHDPLFVSERADLGGSTAIRLAARQALAHAGQTVSDMDLFDFYSCFPAAVQAACDALGVSESDPRGLTVTGGLPFFGGPGNNYSTHAIAEMVRRLRDAPGSSGLVLANGGALAREAVGVYSTQRSSGAWLFDAGEDLQACMETLPKAELDPAPQGRAEIEALTVLWSKQGPQHGSLFGRTASGKRFLARLAADPERLRALGAIDATGLGGRVTRQGDVNLFHPDR